MLIKSTKRYNQNKFKCNFLFFIFFQTINKYKKKKINLKFFFEILPIYFLNISFSLFYAFNNFNF